MEVKEEVRVEGKEEGWDEGAAGVQALAGSACVRSVERERRISAGFRVSNIPAPSANQR